MHRSDALQGQVVVHHREHTLLHLTTVPGVDDALLTGRGVEGHTGLAVQTQLLVVLNLCLRSVVDHEVRLEVGQLLLGGLDEHVLHEVSLPGHLDDEAHTQTGSLVGTAEGIHHIQLLVAQLLDSNLLDLGPYVLAHGMVIVLVLLAGPPDLVLALGVLHDVLVLRRTTGIDTSHHVHGVQLGVLTLVETGQACLGLFLKKILIRRIVGNHGTASDTILR